MLGNRILALGLVGLILAGAIAADPGGAATPRKAKAKPAAATPAPAPSPAPTPSPAPSDEAKPVTERPVTAGDVVATPVSDLNLKKTEIPALLLSAQSDPYGITGLKRCYDIGEAIVGLDKVLGEDFDLPQDDRNKTSAGSVAQAAVGAFIPFRGVIREISGANDHERRLREAVVAGTARRAFLKGYGQAKGCKYPARSVTPAVLTAREAANAAPASPAKADDKTQPAAAEAKKPKPEKKKKKTKRGKDPVFVSEPVVQKVD